MDDARIKYFQSKTNGAVFDEQCNQLTELDYPDLYYYDQDAALWVCEFIETTGRIVEDGHNFSKGDKVKLLDWQIQTICNLFGVKQKKNKLRRYWFTLQFLPKKQGKSPFSAMLANVLTCADGQGRAQIFTVAGDKMQAKIIHENAKEMINADPYLSKNLKVRRDHIEHVASSSTFWVTAYVEETKHGPNLSGVFFDEPHVYKNGELDKTLLKGIMARPEPVVMYTSTAGVRGCWFHMDKYDYAKNVKNVVLRDDRWLVFLYEPDVPYWIEKYGEIWDDEDGLAPWWSYQEVWEDVNPSFGVTVTKDYFENQVTLIKNKPDELNAFLRLHLNLFTGTTVAWSIVSKWYLCGGDAPFSYFEGKDCFVGFYTSRPGDMTCMCLLHDNHYWWRVFVTSESADDRKISTPGFSQWVGSDLIDIVEGNHIDHDSHYDLMYKYLSRVNPIEITHRSEDGELAYRFEKDHRWESNPVSLKGTAIVAATNLFENRVSAGDINHGNNPIMTYQVGMTEIKRLDDNSRPSSDASRDNICCVFAALFATMSSMKDRGPVSPSLITGIEYV